MRRILCAVAVIAIALFAVVTASGGAQGQPPSSTSTLQAPEPAAPTQPTCASMHKYRWVLHRAVRYSHHGGDYIAVPISRRAVTRLVSMRRCAATFGGPGDHAKMVRLWRARKHRWNFVREIDVITPWGEWAIPTYIVMCESGGNYRVPNHLGSGATGAYQIMDDTWASYGGRLWARRAMYAPDYAQHIVASRIWHGGGASQWSCS